MNGQKIQTETGKPGTVPIIYTSDLFHPHDDPDDHFDLATLFAIPEFDIRAIVLDRGAQSKGRTGTVPVEQMMHITGRNVPYAHGMIQDVSWHGYVPEDQLDGVKLIIRAIRESNTPLTIFITGSLRDVAEAYGREPELFQKKVDRLYINAGHSSGKEEWNVKLEPGAYFRMLRAHLPVYWMPCFGDNGYQTYWKFIHQGVLENAPLPVQNFFVYALSKTSPKEADPIKALYKPVPDDVKKKIWALKRNMWCTGGFLHAAGYETATCCFKRVNVLIDENEKTTRITDSKEGHSLLTFYYNDEAAYYNEMEKALKQRLEGLGN